MKILYISAGMHHKNHHALMNYTNITFVITNNTNLNNYDLTTFDAVYSPAIPLDVSLYPNTKFIFGPHFSVFPDHKINNIKSDKTIYLQPSEWVTQLWGNNTLCNNLKIRSLPFGVDVERFKNINEKTHVIVYYKHRNPEELSFIVNFLQTKNIDYRIFSYDQTYDETEYLHYLLGSKYGIWVDAHESQGFALQEALSCNVPLLVWNVTSLNQEYNSNYPNVPATTIPYWDSRCGEYFYEKHEIAAKFDLFLSKLEEYKPREYILENLSFSVCEQKLINLIENI